MKRPVLLTSLCGTLVILGYAGVRHEANAELQRGISNFYAHLPPGVTFTYRKAYPRILFRGAAFLQVKITDAHVTFTTERLLINAPSGAPRTGLHFKLMTATKPRFELQQNLSSKWIHLRAQADGLRLRDVTLPPIDADDHHHVDIKSLVATRVGQLTTDHLRGRFVSDQGIAPSNKVAATPSRLSSTFSADWLDMRGINHNMSSIAEARNIRISSFKGRPPADGMKSREVSEFEAAYVRNVAFSAPDTLRIRLGLPTSDPTILCPKQIGKSSFGKLTYSVNGNRGHIDPFFYETTVDGDVVKTVTSPLRIKADVMMHDIVLPLNMTTLTMTYNGTCNERQRTLNSQFSLNAPRLADLKLSGTMKLISTDRSKIPRVSLEDAHTTYRDLGLIKYGLGLTAGNEAVSPGFLRGLFAEYTSRTVEESPGWVKLAEFLNHFNDYALDLSFTPQKPIEFELKPHEELKIDPFLHPSNWTVTLTP